MTVPAYIEGFGKLEVDGEYYDLLNKPDYDKAVKGDR